MAALGLSLLLSLVAAFFPGCGGEGPKSGEVVLATSTSPVDSGLLEELISLFESRYPYRVKVEVLGSGLALQKALDGECDVTLTHSFLDERQASSSFILVDRREVMRNRFIIAGPKEDPAGIRGLEDPNEAFQRILAARGPFLSRGDGSGTFVAEQQAWMSITGSSKPPDAPWYRLAGKGMAATLMEAGEQGAYTLCDLAVWKVWGERSGLESLVGPEERMANQYVLMRVNPDAFPDVNVEGARAFLDFMTGEEAQRFIGEFGMKEYGEPLFIPAAI